MSDHQGINGVLWHSFRITHVVDCIADRRKTRVIADFSDDISPVFPYLNRIIPNLLYNPGANSITVRREWRILTFYPRVAMMAKMDGPEDARVQLAWFQELCNETWQNREDIENEERAQLQLPARGGVRHRHTLANPFVA